MPAIRLIRGLWKATACRSLRAPPTRCCRAPEAAIQWLALGGDISGAPAGLTVNRLQGRTVSGAAPSNAQVLQWNAAANQWQPAPAQAGNSAYAFSAQVSITIPGTVHQFGTPNLVVDCYDNSSPPQRVEPDKIQISPTTYNVTVNFSTAQTGYCVVNGAGTAAVGAGGSGGAVSSVFGRAGAVMAQTGDYAFGQISGSVGSSQLPGAGGDVSGTSDSRHGDRHPKPRRGRAQLRRTARRCCGMPGPPHGNRARSRAAAP